MVSNDCIDTRTAYLEQDVTWIDKSGTVFQLLLTEEQFLTEYGITFHLGRDATEVSQCQSTVPDPSAEILEETPTYLTVQTDDESMIGSELIFTVRSTLVVDTNWYNITQITLKYNKPVCRLT